MYERPSLQVIRTPARPLPAITRDFLEVRADRAAIRWHVEEMTCEDHPGAVRPRCLVFMAALKMRRVYDYPADWRSLSDAALSALSWGR